MPQAAETDSLRYFSGLEFWRAGCEDNDARVSELNEKIRELSDDNTQLELKLKRCQNELEAIKNSSKSKKRKLDAISTYKQSPAPLVGPLQSWEPQKETYTQ